MVFLWFSYGFPMVITTTKLHVPFSEMGSPPRRSQGKRKSKSHSGTPPGEGTRWEEFRWFDVILGMNIGYGYGYDIDGYGMIWILGQIWIWNDMDEYWEGWLYRYMNHSFMDIYWLVVFLEHDWIILPEISGMPSSQLTKSYFSEG